MAVRSIIRRKFAIQPTYDPYASGTPDFAKRHTVSTRTLKGGHVMISLGEPIK